MRAADVIGACFLVSAAAVTAWIVAQPPRTVQPPKMTVSAQTTNDPTIEAQNVGFEAEIVHRPGDPTEKPGRCIEGLLFRRLPNGWEQDGTKC